ncbi:MAG: choice-of-anchor Q domain-containing protein, partial [Gemmataceae bacterium]
MAHPHRTCRSFWSFFTGQRRHFSPLEKWKRTVLSLEHLEDRLVPATLTVNNLGDTVSGLTPTLDLREAIQLVNTGGTATDASGNSLSAAKASQISGTFGVNDTIQFNAELNGQTITLSGTALEISKSVSIVGLGAGNLAISGNNQSRVFTVDAGAQVSFAALTIEDGNASASGGGGIDNSGGTVTVSNCTLSGNTASGGGGIDNSGGTVTVSNCTLSGNTASGGGGIWNDGGTLTVNNSTLAGNSVSSYNGGSTSGGGAIENSVGTLTVSDSTVADNSSAGSPGGGIVNVSGGSATLNNTIVAGNSTGGDLYLDSGNGSVFSGAYNLIGDGSYLSSFTNSLQGNPLLAPLGNYGGPTQTLALLPGSPAINAGNNALIPSGITTDQRGQPRIVGSAVDIGAFESQGFTITASSGNNQNTPINTSFAAPLTVTVTANNSLEPVNGGVVTFAAPITGASATLSASSAVISGGSVSVTAAANGSAGSYTVAATTSGAGTPASFDLINWIPLAFTAFNEVQSTSSSGALTLTGTFTDLNSPTSASVKINWGDGAPSTTVAANSTQGTQGVGIYTFTASHTFPNSPSASNPVFTITAAASDNIGASSPATEAGLVADGLQGGQAISVAPSSNNSAQITVTVGSFTASFSPPLDGGSVVVFGSAAGNAADNITVQAGLGSPVAVYGGAPDALTVQDPTAADTIAVTSNTVAGNGYSVAYSGLARLLVSGSGGGDTVNMTAIAPGVATTVDGVSGTTSFAANFASAGFSGTLVLDNFTTATFTDAGDFNGALTVNSPGNLQSLSVVGTITSSSNITVTGTLSASTIGTNAGTIGAGSISGMKVTENDGTISASDTTNVSIGTNNGTFTAVENPAVSSLGVMTSTTIGSNCGTVSAGSISSMSVSTNCGAISVAGAGTTNNLTVGTNTSTGTITASEDTNASTGSVSAGSGTLTSTSIGSNCGTVSAGSIS